MAFEAKKFSELFETMRGKSTVLTDFEVGSVTRTLVESFAFEMAALYEKMYLVYLSGFVDTAQALQLDQVVAVLGITRNLPDYAEGEVTFIRDTGSNDILIPIGTLVASEESETKPKKTYATLEEKVLAKNESQISIKVQAFERGEEQVAAAETIIVMPRPIPGIKEVRNMEATRFLGKRRETDDELRRRAKNALIQSGRATTIAIENALLAEPGIKDARVIERFHSALGKITLSGKPGLTLPKGAVIVATPKAKSGQPQVKSADAPPPVSENRSCRTLEELRWEEKGPTDLPVRVESTITGENGEILKPTDFNWTIENRSDITVKTIGPVTIEEYGIIHVNIDGPDVEKDENKKQEILALIEKWRAAGIYVYLKNVQKVKFGGVFRIALDPALKLSPEDRRAYELEVEAAIRLHLDTLRIGETLKFPQVFQKILAIDGIDTVEALRIRTIRKIEEDTVFNLYELADNQITINDEARFDADNPKEMGYISVASEDKDIPFELEFKYGGTTGTLDKTIVENLSKNALKYLKSNPPDGLNVEYLIKALDDGKPVLNTFKIKAIRWSPPPIIYPDPNKPTNLNIDISFVEQPVIGKMFVYENYLDIIGSVNVKFPGFYLQKDKDEKIKDIRTALNAYLDALAPEESVALLTLAEIAKQTPGVLDASVDPDDFQVMLNGAIRLDSPNKAEKTIPIKPFEKARFLPDLTITGDVETIAIQLIAHEIKVDAGMSAADRATIQSKIQTVFNNYPVPQGGNFSFIDLKYALESAAPGYTYAITKLKIKAKSQSDNRVQERDLDNTADIHVRSVELPAIQAIGKLILTESKPDTNPNTGTA